MQLDLAKKQVIYQHSARGLRRNETKSFRIRINKLVKLLGWAATVSL